jgi:uncharacterized oligopeptide transporter (OPT) family protein
MIIGPGINTYVLIGSVIGWGILSPLAKYNGWAPGPVGDWENGSRGWILWVGIGTLKGSHHRNEEARKQAACVEMFNWRKLRGLSDDP